MKCPGQDSRYWGPEAIFDVPCPACGQQVEFFKDEATRRCTGCGFRFRNPNIDVGCAQWCKYAQQCFGSVPLTDQETPLDKVSVLDSLVNALREVVGENAPATRRGMRVVAQAQEILLEEQAVPKIVMAAALLGDLEAPGQVQRVLERAEYDPSSVPAVLSIVAGEAAEDQASEAAVVADASDLVRFQEQLERQEAPTESALDELFRTKSARRRAHTLLAQVSA